MRVINSERGWIFEEILIQINSLANSDSLDYLKKNPKVEDKQWRSKKVLLNHWVKEFLTKCRRAYSRAL